VVNRNLFGGDGLHHSATDRWQGVLEAILRNPFHPKFDLALREMLYFVLNSSVHTWDEPLTSWRKLCQLYDKTIRRRLFDRLLLASVRISGPQNSGFWAVLFESAEDPEAAEYVSRIIEKLDAISRNVDNLERFFGKEVFVEMLIPRLEQEHRFLETCKRIRHSSSEQEEREQVDRLKAILRDAPPRLSRLYSQIETVLMNSKSVTPETACKIAKDARQEFWDRASRQAAALETNEDIWDWVSACDGGSST